MQEDGGRWKFVYALGPSAPCNSSEWKASSGPQQPASNPTTAAIKQAVRHFPGSQDSLRAVISVGAGHKIARKEGTGKVYLKGALDGVEKQVLNTAQAHNGAR